MGLSDYEGVPEAVKSNIEGMAVGGNRAGALKFIADKNEEYRIALKQIMSEKLNRIPPTDLPSVYQDGQNDVLLILTKKVLLGKLKI